MVLKEKMKEETGECFSLNSWLIKCIGDALHHHKEILAFRNGSKIIIFDDIDISVMVEMQSNGFKHPVLQVLRKVDKKPLNAIFAEMDEIKEKRDAGTLLSDEERKNIGRFVKLPRFLRKFFWKRLHQNPFFQKDKIGCATVNSVGLYSKFETWGVAPSIIKTQIIIGSITKEPVIKNDEIIPGYKLLVSLVVNHDLVTGSQIMDFGNTLGEYIEHARGLKECFK